MTNQVLYRVWRPRDFEELAGQEHIRRTLENAILQERISHAYLFAGPRGTGKTSTARILAKALNCADRQGAKPCGVCESCRSIARGNALDVLEIDGASNRGIDEVRELKEKIAFLPAMGKYKVYIVDEAHMLTQEAFNALLKTLEEPPAHVIFILATTDPQKMPPTVLSRCQRFDFRKLPQAAVRARLEEILAAQGREAEPEALAMIVRQAEGSLRDAISLLDQCLSFSLARLTLEDACGILGLVRQEALGSILSALMEGEASALFSRLEALFSQGVDAAQLLREFAGYCRDLLLMALCGTETELVTAAGGERRLMAEQCAKAGAAGLQRMMERLDQAAAGGKYRGDGRYMAEALFAGLLLDWRGGMRGAAAGGAGVREERRAADAAGAGGNIAPGATAGPDAAAARGNAARKTAQEAGPAVPVVPVVSAGPAGLAGHVAEEEGPPPKAAAPGAAAGSDAAAVGIAAEATAAPDARTAAAGTADTAADTAGTAAAARASAAPGLPGESISLSQWERILQIIKGRKIILQACLLASLKQEVKEGVLSVFFDPGKGSFHKERSQEKENLQILREAAEQVLGQALRVECAFLPGVPEKDPVEKAIAMFGREVIKIE